MSLMLNSPRADPRTTARGTRKSRSLLANADRLRSCVQNCDESAGKPSTPAVLVGKFRGSEVRPDRNPIRAIVGELKYFFFKIDRQEDSQSAFYRNLIGQRLIVAAVVRCEYG